MTTQEFNLNFKNNPSKVNIYFAEAFNLASMTLPSNVVILINGEKVIPESKILDGVAVFERISRKPFEINLEFNIYERELELNPRSSFIFPQGRLETLKEVFIQNSVAKIDNTLLNGLGVEEIAILSFNITTIRGTKSVLGSLKCKENYVSNSSTSLVIE